jgi:hypothetical protein
MDGHREHQLAEVNTSAPSEIEDTKVKQESRMKNAPDHPHRNHTVGDELPVVRAALRERAHNKRNGQENEAKQERREGTVPPE